MEISDKVLADAAAFVANISVTVEEATEYISECRRFGCGMGDD